MSDKMKACDDCASTGFADMVWRHPWAMEPRDKICPTCGGRGWVEDLPPTVVRTMSGWLLPARYFTRHKSD